MGQSDAWIVFHGEDHQFAFPVTAEVCVTRILDREELRRHCDAYRSREAIVANLG